jgi:hypothetical protein
MAPFRHSEKNPLADERLAGNIALGRSVGWMLFVLISTALKIHGSRPCGFALGNVPRTAAQAVACPPTLFVYGAVCALGFRLVDSKKNATSRFALPLKKFESIGHELSARSGDSWNKF